MGRPKEENFKPVAVRKEDSGAEKIRKRKLKEEENGRLSSSMAKFTKKCLPISTSMSITDSGVSSSAELPLDNLEQPDNVKSSTEKTDDLSLEEIACSEITSNPNNNDAKQSEIPTEILFDSADPSTWPHPLSAIQKDILLKSRRSLLVGPRFRSPLDML
ncbi:hypothetical protein Fcan01_16159 [Folsomia candida]|uniref:Uncharacterized protein n=1 Tax=Folsomia candida TaxID=158441 RepID=A0A226DTM5_FOLCA|nr:hypothetical protein Fcan01_16159 [Folsomia candida]